MTFMKKMGLSALILCGLTSLVAAKSLSGPKAGSVCDSGIASYLGKAGSMMKHSVVRIAPYVENGNTLNFGYFGRLYEVEGIELNNLLPTIALPENALTHAVKWGMDNGMWMVVTPTKNDELVAQVFIAGRNQQGKAACLTIYDHPVAIDRAAIPDAVME